MGFLSGTLVVNCDLLYDTAVKALSYTELFFCVEEDDRGNAKIRIFMGAMSSD
jgi:hypothetical protein